MIKNCSDGYLSFMHRFMDKGQFILFDPNILDCMSMNAAKRIRTFFDEPSVEHNIPDQDTG